LSAEVENAAKLFRWGCIEQVQNCRQSSALVERYLY